MSMERLVNEAVPEEFVVTVVVPPRWALAGPDAMEAVTETPL